MIQHAWYFRSLGYGYHQIPNSPDPAGCVLWWKVRINGRLHILHELSFSELSEQAIAEGVKELDKKLGLQAVSYTVGGPALFPKKPTAYPGFAGETISERIAFYGLPIVPGDDDALNGWARVQALFRTDAEGVPWLTVSPGCKHLITALGVGISDENKPDEIENEAPPLTALRLGAMTRPSPDLLQSSHPAPVGSPLWYMQQERQKTGGRRVGEVS